MRKPEGSPIAIPAMAPGERVVWCDSLGTAVAEDSEDVVVGATVDDQETLGVDVV